MSLIEKEPIMRFIEDGLNNKHYGHVGVEIITEVEFAPIIDAVPVVRCKDCAHWKPCEVSGYEGKKYCEWAGWLVGENAYCVYGEVKEATK